MGAATSQVSYTASKGGVLAMSRELGVQFAREGIRVNALSPGTIMTPFHERFSTPERLEGIRRQIPLGRLGTAEDCAGAVLYLVSALSAYVTGEVLEVNGGQHFA